MAVFTSTMLLFSLLTMAAKIYNTPPEQPEKIAGELAMSSVMSAAGAMLPPPYGLAVEGVQFVMNANYWLGGSGNSSEEVAEDPISGGPDDHHHVGPEANQDMWGPDDHHHVGPEANQDMWGPDDHHHVGTEANQDMWGPVPNQ